MTLQMSLTQIISAIITLVSVLFFMFYRNWLLTLISLVTVVLCFLMTKVIASRAKGYFTTQWASTGNLNGQIEEMYTGHTVVKYMFTIFFSRSSFDSALSDFLGGRIFCCRWMMCADALRSRCV